MDATQALIDRDNLFAFESTCVVCNQTGSKKCGRCGAVAYCSADCQRRDWPAHKANCAKVSALDAEVSGIMVLLREKKLYSASQRLSLLPSARVGKLAAELERLIGAGIFSETVDDRIILQDSPNGLGLGFVAASNLKAGDDLLFDTAFAAVALDGQQDWYFRIAERVLRRGMSPKRRIDTLVDSQGDFFHDRLLNLCTKHNVARTWFETDGIDPAMRIQMLVCSIAEANCLLCTEDRGYIALFPAAAARLNHSCSPNAVAITGRKSVLVKAIQPIQEGEEICISYLPIDISNAPASDMRAFLLESRGFACKCVRCRAESPQGGWPEDEVNDMGHGTERLDDDQLRRVV